MGRTSTGGHSGRAQGDSGPPAWTCWSVWPCPSAPQSSRSRALILPHPPLSRGLGQKRPRAGSRPGSAHTAHPTWPTGPGAGAPRGREAAPVFPKGLSQELKRQGGDPRLTSTVKGTPLPDRRDLRSRGRGQLRWGPFCIVCIFHRGCGELTADKTKHLGNRQRERTGRGRRGGLTQ